MPFQCQCLNFSENIRKGMTIKKEKTITRITQCQAYIEISLNQDVPKLKMADEKNIALAGDGKPKNPFCVSLITLKRAKRIAANINNKKGEKMISISSMETYRISAVR